MRLISLPFRLLPNGAVATIEEDSEAGDREGITHIALTIRGERPLVPDFGITDPTFDGVNPAEIAASAALYGPAVDIRETRVDWVSDTEQTVEIVFD